MTDKKWTPVALLATATHRFKGSSEKGELKFEKVLFVFFLDCCKVISLSRVRSLSCLKSAAVGIVDVCWEKMMSEVLCLRITLRQGQNQKGKMLVQNKCLWPTLKR
jgi:hypothetical protein